MRILFVTKQYYPTFSGGGEISLKLLCESLQQRGHDIKVIAFDGNKEAIINKIVVRRIGKFKSNSSIIEKFKAIIEIKNYSENYDIIHLYNLFLYEYFGFLTFLFKKPIVATLNNYPILRIKDNKISLKNIKRSIRNLFYLFCFKRIHHFIAISETIKKNYEELGFNTVRMTVIPNMIDPLFIKKPIIREKNKKAIIRYVGILHKNKGIDFLIKSIKLIINEIKNVKLIITGDGEEKENLIKLVKDLNIQKYVKFEKTVKYDSIIKKYDQSDILVHPAIWEEPFGRTILEAISRKKAIIVTNKGEPPKIVGMRKLIVEAENSRKLAKKIKWLLKNKKQRELMGMHLYKKIKNYSPEVILPKIENVYRSIVRN